MLIYESLERRPTQPPFASSKARSGGVGNMALIRWCCCGCYRIRDQGAQNVLEGDRLMVMHQKEVRPFESTA